MGTRQAVLMNRRLARKERDRKDAGESCCRLEQVQYLKAKAQAPWTLARNPCLICVIVLILVNAVQICRSCQHWVGIMKVKKLSLRN